MKRLKLWPVIFLFFFANMLQAQQVIFPAQWKFMMGDEAQFSKVDYDDSQWQPIMVPMAWEKAGVLKERSIGWYRIKVTIPKNLLGQDLVFYAGTIDDADELYFNNHLAGATGKFPPGDQSAWDVQRKYIIKKEWVKSQSTIAIRVYNGIGGAGLYGGRVEIITKAESDRQIAAQLKSKKSYYNLTTSNGLISAVYNERTQLIENYYPHIFTFYDSAQVVKPVAINIGFKHLTAPLATHYLHNTHIIHVTYKQYSVDYVSSFTRANKMLYIILKGDETAIRRLSLKFNEVATIDYKAIDNKNGKLFERTYILGFQDSLHHMPDVEQELARIKETDIVDAELKFMRHTIEKCHFPLGLSATERNVMEQSIAILKMSQVGDNEIFPLSHGQVLASLRPGVWAICWVRDGAFAIEAMSKLGMYNEAKKALEFMLKAQPTNQYVHYVHTDGLDYGLGVPYIISLTRYFGNGREESDFNENGPNIEIDDLGLFLTAFYHYVKESGDSSFYGKWACSLHTIAAAIEHNINAKGVIRRDSGPWEHHLPGKEFMWTSGVCARGLELLTELQRGDKIKQEFTLSAAKRLKNGIEQKAVIDGKYLKGNTTETLTTDHHYFDAATFELFANGLFTYKKLFATHMQEYDKHNRAVGDKTRGYIRFNSADSYENQEWPFAALRVAVAQKKLGSKAEAKKLIDRVSLYASRNNNHVPEILTNDLCLYSGAIPMVGYGAGAYVLAVIAYYNE